MLIRELENGTGLERATIRYYESLGFINPVRQENGYRIYSQEDLDTLLKIKLLRQLGLSLEKIQEIRQGSVDFSEALGQQIEALERQITDSHRAVEICSQIKSSGTSFENLDANHYLKEMARERIEQPPVPEFRRITPVHPWKRFFARVIDEALLSRLLFFLMVVVFRLRPVNGGLYPIVNWAIIQQLLMIPVQALLLHYFGTTPGKWIFGIRIESVNGGNPSIQDGLRRGWAVLRFGYGFTIPIYQIWRLYRSYKDSEGRGYTDWDYEAATEARFDYYYETRKKFAVVGIALVYLLTVWVSMDDLFRPRYRGDALTVAQIAENYNDWLDFANDGEPAASGHLTDSGRFSSVEFGENAVVISLNGTPKDGVSDFVFTETDGVVRSITYDETWTDFTRIQPMGGRIILMTLTAASAQDWFGLIPMTTFMLDLEKQFNQPQGQVLHENLIITWSVLPKNSYQNQNGIYYANQNGQAEITVHFEIQILEQS